MGRLPSHGDPFSRIFFFNDTATTEIYTLSLHDALPISREPDRSRTTWRPPIPRPRAPRYLPLGDRKSTRLNSSHSQISYAVFCLKKKNNYATNPPFHDVNLHELAVGNTQHPRHVVVLHC